MNEGINSEFFQFTTPECGCVGEDESTAPEPPHVLSSPWGNQQMGCQSGPQGAHSPRPALALLLSQVSGPPPGWNPEPQHRGLAKHPRCGWEVQELRLTAPFPAPPTFHRSPGSQGIGSVRVSEAPGLLSTHCHWAHSPHHAEGCFCIPE